MRKNYFIYYLALLAFNLLAISGYAQSERSTINIDLGPSGEVTAAPWNNINSVSAGSGVENLTNMEGVATGYSIVITQPFNTWNVNGPLVTPDSLALPANASRDSFYGNTVLFNNQTIPEAALVLSNLDVNKAYSFAFFGSRMATGNENRETLYTVEGATTSSASLNAFNNSSRMAHVSNIRPKADGTIDIVVKPGPNNTNNNKFFYLSAIRVTYSNTVAGIAKDIAQGNINVYPNPATGLVSINAGSGQRVESVQLVSVAGVRVLERSSASGSLESLDVAGLAKGLYYMHIKTNKGQFRSKLVVN